MVWCGLSWLMFLLPWISEVNCGVLKRPYQTAAEPLTSTHTNGVHWLGQFDQMFGKNNWWETETNKVSRFYTPSADTPVLPLDDTPVLPLDDTRVEPQVDISVQHLVHTPVQPLFHTPVQPLVHTPVQPIAHTPVQSLIYSPVQPLAQLPVQPLAQLPVQPLAQLPVQPLIYSPVQPLTQLPVQPQVHSPQLDYPFYPNYQPISTYPQLPYDYQMPPPIQPSHEDNCYTAEGEVGTCTSAFRCDETYGHPGGMCYQGYDGSPRVCCVYPTQCGYNTNHRVTYFRGNDAASSPSSCSYRVNLLPNVCQIRLDFLDFRTKPPLNGLCDPSNRLLISSGGRRATIPMKELCGTIANPEDKDPLVTDVPHVYVHFDMETDHISNKYEVPHLSMEMVTSGVFTPSWNIRVGQVTCDGARLQAPPGCAQFYPEPKGAIASLNLIDNQYLLDTSLTVCLAGDNSACAVRYLMNKMQVGPSKTGGLGYGLVCRDFVKFLGEKTGICGVGDGREMILPIRGPLGLSFSSDIYHIPGSDVGYNIDYEFLHSCEDNVSFFKYPATK